MKQKIYSGYNSYKKIYYILKGLSPKKIFLVTGKKSYFLSGAKNLLSKFINKYNYFRFYDFETNPKLEYLMNGINIFNREKCDIIIGVGGGSVMDIAKSISILATQQGGLEEFIKGKISLKKRQIPSIMIPTTAGTGSESTHFSVIYINKIKYSLAHYSLLPDFAILDPFFTENLPPHITASTSMDALCQGIESFWSTNSTEESRIYSKQAMKLIISNIIKNVNNPDTISREKMLLASNLAGKAINIAKTTAPHAVSYPITSYFNIPHGHAVALTLPCFIEFNNDVSLENLQDNRGIKFVKNRMSELFTILKVKTANKAKDKIINIMKKINLETRLSKLGINRNNIDVIIENGFNPQRMKSNPKLVSEKDLRVLIDKII
ncbi:alcohol dehydrogenase [Candidatus Atribacteria bacterium HGW-Atribacteria-1]|nr:MAG: alcohol dehydrogenase [Candidatus Atribacteria bacterium HGW-Atribacteria-1]